VTTRSEFVTEVEYVSRTLLLSQVGALALLLVGTYIVCTVSMRRSGATVGPLSALMNPVMLSAMVLALVLGRFFLGSDLLSNDNNQRARLRKYGVTTTGKVLSVVETSNGRYLNPRYRWAEIACEFVDQQGKTWRGTTIEGYNSIYSKRAPWQTGEAWSPGSRTKMIYMADNPLVFRIADAVRHDVETPATRGDFLLALFWIWYAPVGWLGVLLWAVSKSSRRARAVRVVAAGEK
jgi:hypothetical protein